MVRADDRRPEGHRGVAKRDELQVDQMKLLHIGGKRIVLARTEDGYVAFDDRCTHKGGSLAGGVMVCGTVNVSGTGRSLTSQPARSKPDRQRNRSVCIRWTKIRTTCDWCFDVRPPTPTSRSPTHTRRYAIRQSEPNGAGDASRWLRQRRTRPRFLRAGHSRLLSR